MAILNLRGPGKSGLALVIFLLIILISVSEIVAEESLPADVRLGVTATTPTRLEQPIDEVSGSVTILTEPIIESQEPVGIQEVLRDQSGVAVRESGTMGEQTSLMLRGTESYQSLVLQDGIRVNSPFRGSFDIGNQLIDNIGQIEIVRGAQSSLYGSQAMGGVVNIQTRKARFKREAFLFAEAGNFGTFREGFGVGGIPTWGNYTFTVSRTDSKGDPDNDRYGATTLSSRLQLDFSPNSQLLIIPRYQKDKKELPVTPLEFFLPIEIISDDNNEIKRRFFSNVISYRQIVSSWWDITLRGGIVQTYLDWENPAAPGADPADLVSSFTYFEKTDERELTVDLQQNVTWKEDQVFTLGVEYLHDDVNSDIESSIFPFPVSIDSRRHNKAAYAQQIFKWDRKAFLQVGARLDDDSNFGTVLNPKVSASYKVQRTQTKVRGSWGRGFRAPTIQELGFGELIDPDFDPDDLKPEKSQNWEVGANQRLWDGMVEIDIVYFQIDFEDLIKRIPTVDNVAEAQSRGVETQLSIKPLPMVQFNANHTYLDTEDKSTGQELAFRTRNRWNFNLLFFPLANLVFNLDVNIVSSQSIPVVVLPNPPGDDIKIKVFDESGSGFTRVDLAVSYQFIRTFLFARKVKLFAHVKNVFDEDYQEVPGFPSPGVSFLAGIKVTI